MKTNKNRITKFIRVITSPAFMLAFVAGAATCYTSYNPTCPDQSEQACPDGNKTGGFYPATCTSSDTKTLNQVYTEEGGTGYNLTSSSGNCTYHCNYLDGDVQVGCGSKTNAWTGSKPGTTTCIPDGGGSGS